MPQEFDRDRERDRDRGTDRDFGRDWDRDRDFDRDRRRSPFDFFRFLYPGPLQPPPRRGGPPGGPPPSAIPGRPVGTRAIDPGAISFCHYRFTYVWPEMGRAFWFYPVFLGPRSISGFRWTGSAWVYYGMDLNDIDAFQCV